MITFVALVVLIVVFCGCLKFVATFGDKAAAQHLKKLRDATPAHHQGREADFDEHGRPW